MFNNLKNHRPLILVIYALINVYLLGFILAFLISLNTRGGNFTDWLQLGVFPELIYLVWLLLGIELFILGNNFTNLKIKLLNCKIAELLLFLAFIIQVSAWGTHFINGPIVVICIFSIQIILSFLIQEKEQEMHYVLKKILLVVIIIIVLNIVGLLVMVIQVKILNINIFGELIS